jgi:hypothetical protein
MHYAVQRGHFGPEAIAHVEMAASLPLWSLPDGLPIAGLSAPESWPIAPGVCRKPLNADVVVVKSTEDRT